LQYIGHRTAAQGTPQVPGNTSANIARNGDGKFHFNEKKITVENPKPFLTVLANEQ
jgi:hypothetical protein